MSPRCRPNEGVRHREGELGRGLVPVCSVGVGGLSLGARGGGRKCHKNQGAAARPSRRITAAVK